jgi:non-heme chloroperoxidase
MFKYNNPQYYYADDGARLFFNTNFKLQEYDPKKYLLIFNYGLVCNMHHWEYQLNYFDDLGLQILIHNYRGHYNSGNGQWGAPYSFNQMAHDIYSILSSLGIQVENNIIMLGHSMGVNITLEFAKDYPETLAGIILISGTVISPMDVIFNSKVTHLSHFILKKLYKYRPGFLEQFWKNMYLLPFMNNAIHSGGFNKEKVSMSFIELYMKKIGELGPEVFFNFFELLCEHDIILHLEKIQTPSLIIGGDNDKVIPNYLQFILKNYLPKSDIYIVRDGSHVPQRDFPDSINERIHRFLDFCC